MTVRRSVPLYRSAIYQRTSLGRGAAWDDVPHVSPSARQLLLLFNGLRPLEQVTRAASRRDALRIAESLVRDGLIEPLTKTSDEDLTES